MRNLWQLPLIGIVVLSLSPAMQAQKAPPIPGVTGTLVTPETAKDEKKAEDKAAVAVKEAVTPNDNKGPLSDLAPGTTVVIRHGSNVTEGVVSKIDRSANEITVRYDNKKIEKLVLADRSSGDTRTVEYTNDTKQKVTRYFRLKS
jgi:phage baseplate assembly protein gpV